MGVRHFNPLAEMVGGRSEGGSNADEEQQQQQQLEARMRAEVISLGDVHRLIKQPSLNTTTTTTSGSSSSTLGDGSEVDAAKLQAAFRFVRDAAEWGKIRGHLAHTMQLCIRPEGEHGNSRQKVVDMFVSRSDKTQKKKKTNRRIEIQL